MSISGLSSGAGSVMHQVTAYGGLKGKVPFKRVIPLSPVSFSKNNKATRLMFNLRDLGQSLAIINKKPS